MFKKVTLGIALLFVVMISASTQAQAQETKIGFVNPQAILDRMPEMKAIQQRLKNFAERKAQEIQQKEIELQNAVNVYEQKKDVISATAKQAEEEKLQKMSNDLNEADRNAQAEVQAKRNELLGPLLNQISEAINTVAKEKGLSYVLNVTTNTGDMIILYASEEYGRKYNITDAVMLNLGI